MATPESRVKNKIKEYLAEIGAWFVMTVPHGYGVKGIPDFICCVPVTITPEMVGRRLGVFMVVEAKAEGCTIKDVKQWQLDRMEEIRAAYGGTVIGIGDDAVPAIRHALLAIKNWGGQ